MGKLYSEPSRAELAAPTTDPKLRTIIESIKDLPPSSIRELFENTFAQMDMNAREATFRTLCNSCTEYQLQEMPFEIKPNEGDQDVNSNRVIDRQFTSFSNRPPPPSHHYFDILQNSRGDMEDQIMQILVQVLHRAERTNPTVTSLLNSRDPRRE